MSQPGEVIDGAYKLIKPLGKGGMATVYLAEVDLSKVNYTLLYAYTQVQADSHAKRVELAEELSETLKDKDLDWKTIRSLLEAQNIPVPPRKVALKLAHQGIRSERFDDEWKYLICLSHPNVIKVFGGGECKGRPYYIMEYLPKMISEQELIGNASVEKKLRIISMAGEGLSYLHDNGIVHRDVKPDNFITVSKSGGELLTKVTDLGLAKDTAAEMGMTGSAAILGTPFFMSPEQMKSSRDIDHRTDIYSLGASLYEFTTGKKPFHQKSSVVEILKTAIEEESPIPPERHVENFPEELSGILKCSMSIKIEERYEGMGEFLSDLRTFLQKDSGALASSMIISEEILEIDFSSSDYIYPSKLPLPKKNKKVVEKIPQKQSTKKRSRKKSDKGRKRNRPAAKKGGCMRAFLFFLGFLFFLAVLILGAFVWSNREVLFGERNQPQPRQETPPPARREPPRNTTREPDEPRRSGGLKVYQSLQEAPQNGFLVRDKKTKEILDISGLPPAFRSRYSKNPQDYEVIRRPN